MIYSDFSYQKHFDDDRELNEQAQDVQEEVKQEKKETEEKITERKRNNRKTIKKSMRMLYLKSNYRK